MTPESPAALSSSNFAAYYRVSTFRQGESGLGLDAQREAVARYLSAQGGKLAAEFTETESGKRASTDLSSRQRLKPAKKAGPFS